VPEEETEWWAEAGRYENRVVLRDPPDNTLISRVAALTRGLPGRS
jgi:hypothetical protein